MPGTSDGLPGFNFRVEISGITEGPFSGLDLLESSIAVIEVRHGTDEGVRKVPGRHRAGDVRLRRPYAAVHDLFDWFEVTRRGTIDRRDGSVIILGADRATESARFNFYGAWPTRWQLSTFDADTDALLVEEIVLTCERIERV
jgi:phage tail-like protein